VYSLIAAAFGLLTEICPSETEALHTLEAAWNDLTSLRQVLAIAVVETDPEQFSAGLKSRLASALQRPDFKAVQDRLRSIKDSVRQTLAEL